MKYIILRLEDQSFQDEEVYPLLDGAKLTHMNEMAQVGAAGTLRWKTGDAPERLALLECLFGLGRDGGYGRWYTEASRVPLEPGERVWCCDFVTQENDRIVDPTAGALSDQEGRLLIQALDEQLGSDIRRWEPGEGSRHVLVLKDRTLDALMQVPSPNRLVGADWRKQIPRSQAGDALELLVTQAAKVLEKHSVNGVRTDLGENPANLAWFWGGASMIEGETHQSHFDGKAALISGSFALRGAARLYGYDFHPCPGLDEEGIRELEKQTRNALARNDLLGVHVMICEGDRIERSCILERLDRLLLRSLVQYVNTEGAVRLLVVADNRMKQALPFVAMGEGLPDNPLSQMQSAALMESPLHMKSVQGLYDWFMES